MTQDKLDDVSIRSDEEFRVILATAFEVAIEAGVDVRGAWEFRTNGSAHAWDVVISELRTDGDGTGGTEGLDDE